MHCHRGVHAQVGALCVHEWTPHCMEKELGLNGGRHPEDRDAQVGPSGALLTFFAHAPPSWLERKPLQCCVMGDPSNFMCPGSLRVSAFHHLSGSQCIWYPVPVQPQWPRLLLQLPKSCTPPPPPVSPQLVRVHEQGPHCMHAAAGLHFRPLCLSCHTAFGSSEGACGGPQNCGQDCLGCIHSTIF